MLNWAELNKENEFQEILNELNVIKIEEVAVFETSKGMDSIRVVPHRRIDKTQFGKNVSYSFLLENFNDVSIPNQFRNLVVEKRNGKSAAMIVTYLLENNELLPIKIERLNSDIDVNSVSKYTCEAFIVTVKTWCSENVHYGHDSDCRASDKGETYTSKFSTCSGGGGNDYGYTTFISGPNYYTGEYSEGGTGGGDGSGSIGTQPEELDPDEPFAAPVLEDVLVSYKPTFRYPVDSDYAQRYPKLTEYLRNKLPNVKDMPVITNALQDITSLSLSQIQHDLEWGNGPTITIIQLDNYAPITDYKTVGLFDPAHPELIFLDIDYVLYLENDVTDQALEDGLLFYLGVVLLHEYTHQGVNAQGIDFPGEEGAEFEIRAYGENLEPSSAQDLILTKYYGYE
ncbi:hypothetical protein FHG64_00660 [Antarcticibacterium flavum]|uniref:Tox-MPTase3 domain-containing protein n=1 Tax=Antarcticibacterium flavum TaxID=2058175 RepID=A0A5B7WXW6_9FLAO|nr:MULTISPECIES: hypothetical protein [Antarcticibacterium]MCM4161689.1 hypothetical protein [Antarcticibacterium sp. W02-3]QCY68024.1 hypothetical protein FHG64_00660 [Antarcticibacterium flavum]